MNVRSRIPALNRTDDQGAIVVIVALFMLVFMVLLAIVVDLGQVYGRRAALQNAADAAALAAAQDLPVAAGCFGVPPTTGTSACKVAGDFVVSNGFARADTTVTSTGASNQIAVQITSDVPYVFGRIVGAQGKTVVARAVATKAAASMGNFAFFTENDVANKGNPKIVGDVYAGNTLDLQGNSKITGNVFVGGLASPASAGTLDVSGSALVTGNATATGKITAAKNSIQGTQTQNGSVPAITAVQYATSVGLVARIALDQADANSRSIAGNCSLSDALTTTTVLICSGSFSTASNNDWRASKPSLRTIIAKDFDWSGQQTNIGLWPNNPFLFYATDGGFTGNGGTDIDGYLYAPKGGFDYEGNTNGSDFRVITSGDITVNGDMSTAGVQAYENSTLGKVTLTE